MVAYNPSFAPSAALPHRPERRFPFIIESYKTRRAVIPFRASQRVIFSSHYDSPHRQANYQHHVDYDADYLRFGRVEKQLDQ
jgi:hypothetical protein